MLALLALELGAGLHIATEELVLVSAGFLQLLMLFVDLLLLDLEHIALHLLVRSVFLDKAHTTIHLRETLCREDKHHLVLHAAMPCHVAYRLDISLATVIELAL